jgi:hypothetical protein
VITVLIERTHRAESNSRKSKRDRFFMKHLPH